MKSYVVVVHVLIIKSNESPKTTKTLWGCQYHRMEIGRRIGLIVSAASILIADGLSLASIEFENFCSKAEATKMIRKVTIPLVTSTVKVVYANV